MSPEPLAIGRAPRPRARRLDALDEKALLSLRNHLAEHKPSTVNLVVRTLMAMLRSAERLVHKVRLLARRQIARKNRRIRSPPRSACIVE